MKTLEDYLAELSPEERAEIEVRAAELIEEELRRRRRRGLLRKLQRLGQEFDAG